MASHPELGIGNMDQLPPGLLACHLGGLEVSQAEFLFAKTEEVFQVEALLVALINMEQAQFVASLTHHEQPQGMLECLFTLLIITDNLHQGEGILIHGQALGFVDARHQHVMPGPDFDAVALASATGLPKGLALIRFAAGVEFTFPVGATLAPGERIIVVRNRSAFEAVHGTEQDGGALLDQVHAVRLRTGVALNIDCRNFKCGW